MGRGEGDGIISGLAPRAAREAGDGVSGITLSPVEIMARDGRAYDQIESIIDYISESFLQKIDEAKSEQEKEKIGDHMALAEQLVNLLPYLPSAFNASRKTVFSD